MTGIEIPKNDLTRLTVNLTRRSVVAFEAAAGIEGLSKTDTVNRALQAWAYLLKRTQDGAVLKLHQPDGSVEAVMFL